ncbi:MAG: hypothetical protein NZZ41_04750 [Candidatus Dojkabacteria bacterium]|nr:hypothetical protein [Candidatus Dojkabacteria bacterium]
MVADKSFFLSEKEIETIVDYKKSEYFFNHFFLSRKKEFEEKVFYELIKNFLFENLSQVYSEKIYKVLFENIKPVCFVDFLEKSLVYGFVNVKIFSLISNKPNEALETNPVNVLLREIITKESLSEEKYWNEITIPKIKEKIYDFLQAKILNDDFLPKNAFKKITS